MLRTMITATNTMNQLQKQLDTIGNNLANVDTQGFKRTNSTFSELINQQMNNAPYDEAVRQTPPGLRMGTGAKLTQTVVFSQGSIKDTGRALDIAFTKPGQFLQVEVDGETRYTRDGALYVTPTAENPNELMLVTSAGHPILDENLDRIILDDTFKDVAISPEGVLTATPKNANDLPQIFTLGVVNVNQPQLLEQLGGNLYGLDQIENLADVIAYLDETQVAIKPQALETSNVDMGEEMTNLMISQRSYQMNAKSISLGDQMLGLINGVR